MIDYEDAKKRVARWEAGALIAQSDGYDEKYKKCLERAKHYQIIADSLKPQ